MPWRKATTMIIHYTDVERIQGPGAGVLATSGDHNPALLVRGHDDNLVKISFLNSVTLPSSYSQSSSFKLTANILKGDSHLRS